MGMFRAITAAVSGAKEIQWKDFFVCEALPEDVLLARGSKRISGRSANDDPNDDTITHGSLILIADGQCAIVVSGGRVLASCMTPGEYTYEDPEHASGLRSVLRETGRRISFGGDAPSVRGNQHVYYLNTKEIVGNPYTAVVPVALAADASGGEVNANMVCGGTFSYRIADPERFYKLIAGNVSGAYNRSRLTHQIENELQKNLGAAVSVLSRQGLRPSGLPEYTSQLCGELRRCLSAGWMGNNGLEMVSLGMDRFAPESTGEIQMLQYTSARREAVSAPVRNMIREGLTGSGGNALAAAIRGNTGWTCRCGTVSTGKFCPECGGPRPEEWVCVCSARNQSRFCTNCGRPRPE